MLKVPDHQIAGHRALLGQLGPLIDDSGRFYKPLQSDGRGSKEVAFYEQFWSTEQRQKIPDQIREFFPFFHGTEIIEASDKSGPKPHLVLEDIVSSRANPSVMDLKIGARTWYPQASEEYITKSIRKDRASTSCSLGFRVSGFQVFGGEEHGFWKPTKKCVDGFSEEDVGNALRRFVSSNNDDNKESRSVEEEPDCAFAQTVYGGPNGILVQLLNLKDWFEDQTLFHFYSCSILVVYDETKPKTKEKSFGPVIKLVDFAHELDGRGVIDHNFLGGLCSLIKFIRDILNSLSHTDSDF